mmetsp:Transcript_146323/g.407613  ORF Transcript_146323/g.407613 Transcript_146323/m.407613 type:complete len:205 (+) Transcript_146323:128-742(+)
MSSNHRRYGSFASDVGPAPPPPPPAAAAPLPPAAASPRLSRSRRSTYSSAANESPGRKSAGMHHLAKRCQRINILWNSATVSSLASSLDPNCMKSLRLKLSSSRRNLSQDACSYFSRAASILAKTLGSTGGTGGLGLSTSCFTSSSNPLLLSRLFLCARKDVRVLLRPRLCAAGVDGVAGVCGVDGGPGVGGPKVGCVCGRGLA